MKSSPLPPLLILLTLLAQPAPAQTSLWTGQTPPDATRLSAWTDGTNWSTGTVPSGATAAAQIPAGNYTAAMPLLDKLQIADAGITLDALHYVQNAAAYYYSSYPLLLIGGPNAGDQGSLEFTGEGITSHTPPGGYYTSNPEIQLENGKLGFANQAGFNTAKLSSTGLNITTTAGTENQVWFGDNSSAYNITLSLNPGSRLDVTGQARLESSNVNFNGGYIGYSGQSSMVYGSVYVYGPGLMDFSDHTTVTSLYISFNRPAPANDSIIRFSGHAQVQGGSVYSSGDSGVIEFIDQADGSGFNINYVRQLEVTGATTGTGTTGRLRATTNTPTATSVVADDARTINLGNVTVEDLLLGSNSVRVTGGSLRYISDVGGAYLSASGANLTGGGIIMAGPATYSYYYYSNPLYLTATQAASPYAVPLTIESGAVISTRQRLGAVSIAPAGTLSVGTGVSDSVINQGLLQLSGTDYKIAGNYTQAATGSLGLQTYYPYYYYPTTSALGHLEVTGQAQLDGTLQFTPGGYFVGSKRYSFLKAGSISGRFANAPALTLSPMLSVGVDYTSNDVAIAYVQRPFALAGATPSQQDLGTHLDATLPTVAGNYYNLVLHLNTLQDPALIAAGLGQLAPDRYGVLNEQGFASAAARQSGIDRRLAWLRAAPATTDTVSVFVEGGQVRNEFNAISGLPAVSFQSSGGLGGATWRHDRWILGLTAARESASADLDGLGSHAQIHSTIPGFFAQYATGRYFIHASASRSADDYDLVRNSGLAYRPSVVSATTKGSRTDLSVTAGTTFQPGSWTVEPYAGLLSSDVRLDDFAEKNVSGASGSELAFSHWSVGSLRTRAGVDLWRHAAQGRLVPRLSLVWLHELEQDRGLSAGLLAAGGARYRAPGRPAETDLVQAGLGVDWFITRRFSFSANAGTAWGRNSAITSDLTAGFRWEF